MTLYLAPSLTAFQNARKPLARAFVASSHEAVRHHGRVHSACARAADCFDFKPPVFQ